MPHLTRSEICRNAALARWGEEYVPKWPRKRRYGDIPTAEQRANQNAGLKRTYRRRKEKDPEFLGKQHAKRRAKIIANGTLNQEQARVREATKSYYRKDPIKVSERDKSKRVQLIAELGGKCVECGFNTDIRALVLDHMRGDGYLDRKRIGSKVYRYYLVHLNEARQNLQVLCANCNMIKAVEMNEHNRSRRINGASYATGSSISPGTASNG